METGHPTPRDGAITSRQRTRADCREFDLTPPREVEPGFEVDDMPLPAVPVGIPDAARRLVAIVLLRIARGDTPESVVYSPSIEAWRLFDECNLERDEALAHADVVLSVLADALAAR